MHGGGSFFSCLTGVHVYMWVWRQLWPPCFRKWIFHRSQKKGEEKHTLTDTHTGSPIRINIIDQQQVMWKSPRLPQRHESTPNTAEDSSNASPSLNVIKTSTVVIVLFLVWWDEEPVEHRSSDPQGCTTFNHHYPIRLLIRNLCGLQGWKIMTTLMR